MCVGNGCDGEGIGIPGLPTHFHTAPPHFLSIEDIHIYRTLNRICGDYVILISIFITNKNKKHENRSTIISLSGNRRIV